jgi:hypothetical protein
MKARRVELTEAPTNADISADRCGVSLKIPVAKSAMITETWANVLGQNMR